MHGPKTREGAPNPAPWPFRALWLHAPKRPIFLVEPIVQRPRFLRVLVDTGASLGAISREDARVDVDAAPCLPTSGRQYRPRTVQCRSRRSFHEGNGRRTLKMPDEPIWSRSMH